MEFSAGNYKYIVVKLGDMVSVICINTVNQAHYRAIIDPTRYAGIGSADDLYAILVYAFQTNDDKCRLNITFDHMHNIVFLRVDVTLPERTINITEILQPLIMQMQHNDNNDMIGHLYERVREHSIILQKIYTRISSLQYSVQRGDDNQPSGKRCYNSINKFVVNGEMIQMENIILPRTRFHIDRIPAYLQATNAAEVEINGDVTDSKKVTQFIRTIIHSVTNLRKLSISNVEVGTVKSIMRLPNLMQLELRQCGPIADLHMLRLMCSLLIVSITADTAAGQLDTWPKDTRPYVAIIN